MRVIDCMSGKVTEFNVADAIAFKLANGLDHAVYRNGVRHTDWPLTREDCEVLTFRRVGNSSVYH